MSELLLFVAFLLFSWFVEIADSLNKDLEYCGYLSVCPSEIRMAGMDKQLNERHRVRRRRLDGQTSAPGR